MNSEIDTLLIKWDAHPGSLIFARVASAYLRSDNTNQAIQVCEQGLSQHSDYANGHMVMAMCYFKVGLLEQAIRECERVLELDREHPSAFFYLGEIYAEQKQFDQALHAYQKVLQHDPYNESAQERLAQLQTRTAESGSRLNPEGAEDDRQAPMDDSIITPTLADIYASQGLTERAIHVLRCFLGRASNQEDVLRRIRELEEELRITQAGGDHGNHG